MFWRHNFLGISWSLFILALCGLPGSTMPETHIVGFDKVIHVSIYALYVVILSVGFKKQNTYKGLRYRALPIALVFSICYGLLIEVLQGTVFVSRSIEFADMLANTLGSFIGLACFYLIYRNPKN